MLNFPVKILFTTIILKTNQADFHYNIIIFATLSVVNIPGYVYYFFVDYLLNTLEIILLIVLPFIWGLGVEFIFERYRRGKPSAGKTLDDDRLS